MEGLETAEWAKQDPNSPTGKEDSVKGEGAAVTACSAHPGLMGPGAPGSVRGSLLIPQLRSTGPSQWLE